MFGRGLIYSVQRSVMYVDGAEAVALLFLKKLSFSNFTFKKTCLGRKCVLRRSYPQPELMMYHNL